MDSGVGAESRGQYNGTRIPHRIAAKTVRREIRWSDIFNQVEESKMNAILKVGKTTEKERRGE